MFRRFFAEGTLNVAFVPMFAKKHEAERARWNSPAMPSQGWLLS